MDGRGRAYVDRVRLLNLSRNGALIEDVSCGVKIGDTVALRCDDTTRRFRVVWERSGNGEGRQLGLAATAAVPATLEKWLPATGHDNYVRPRAGQRRQHTRYDCEIATELRLHGGETPMWVTACDVSEGGLRVQVPHSMTPLTEMSIALWLDGERVWMRGMVTHSLYGCGTGIRFTQLQQSALQRIRDLVATLPQPVPERRDSTGELNELCAAYSVTS